MESNIIKGLTFSGRKACREMVYVLEASNFDYIKIGRTVAPKQRVRNLQSGCPFRIHTWLAVYTPDASELESRLHDELSEYRLRGEWFSAPGSVLDGLVTLFAKANRIARKQPNNGR